MDTLFIDFETRSAVDLKKSGADVYARDVSTRVMAFGYAFNEDPVTVIGIGERPEPAIYEHVNNGLPVVAHNANFEWLIWNFTWRREFSELPELKASQLICTMAMSYAMALPGSLEKAAAAVGIEMQKDMAGQRVMLQLCQPTCLEPLSFIEPDTHPDKFKKMYDYCAVDVGVERELLKRLLKLSPNEKKLWELDHKINQRGIRVDEKAIRAAIRLAELEKKRLDLEIRRVTKNAVAMCTATGQLTDWLKSRGVEAEGVAKNDVIELLAQDLPEDCRQALLLRQEAAKSSNAKLPSMLNSMCGDGRIRSIFQYHGAGTGRWAGRRIQPQNFPRPKLSGAAVEEIFHLLHGV